MVTNINILKENIEGYKFMFIIENSLRELIIDIMQKKFGPKWYKSRIPGDINAKYINAINCEKKIKWQNLVPHHPIYYIDFPDLKKIIIQKNNWDEIFKRMFGNKEWLIGLFNELEFIRNIIAHNRNLSKNLSKYLSDSFKKLSKIIGEDKMIGYVNNCTCEKSIPLLISDLSQELEITYKKCLNFKAIQNDVVVWNKVMDKWWFDELYLGSSIYEIEVFFKFMIKYSELPRKRGQGHIIEDWVYQNDISSKFKKAKNEFRNLLIGEG
jgi:hypothetical protein